jgi:hypothetical protein
VHAGMCRATSRCRGGRAAMALMQAIEVEVEVEV